MSSQPHAVPHAGGASLESCRVCSLTQPHACAELNSFGMRTGAALFDWDVEADLRLLCGGTAGPAAVRVVRALEGGERGEGTAAARRPPLFVVRPACDADAAAVGALWHATYFDQGGAEDLSPDFQAERRSKPMFETRAAAMVPRMLVAVGGGGAADGKTGGVLGFAVVELEGAEAGEVNQFFVAKVTAIPTPPHPPPRGHCDSASPRVGTVTVLVPGSARACGLGR